MNDYEVKDKIMMSDSRIEKLLIDAELCKEENPESLKNLALLIKINCDQNSSNLTILLPVYLRDIKLNDADLREILYRLFKLIKSGSINSDYALWAISESNEMDYSTKIFDLLDGTLLENDKFLKRLIFFADKVDEYFYENEPKILKIYNSMSDSPIKKEIKEIIDFRKSLK